MAHTLAHDQVYFECDEPKMQRRLTKAAPAWDSSGTVRRQREMIGRCGLACLDCMEREPVISQGRGCVFGAQADDRNGAHLAICQRLSVRKAVSVI